MENIVSLTDKQCMVSSFLEIAVGQIVDTACHFLQAANWRIEDAMQLFYVENEGRIAASSSYASHVDCNAMYTTSMSVPTANMSSSLGLIPSGSGKVVERRPGRPYKIPVLPAVTTPADETSNPALEVIMPNVSTASGPIPPSDVVGSTCRQSRRQRAIQESCSIKEPSASQLSPVLPSGDVAGLPRRTSTVSKEPVHTRQSKRLRGIQAQSHLSETFLQQIQPMMTSINGAGSSRQSKHRRDIREVPALRDNERGNGGDGGRFEDVRALKENLS